VFARARRPSLPAIFAAVPTSTPPSHWVHDLSPFLIQFNENFGIRYYGLSYVVGFLACGWLLRRYHRAGRSALDHNASADLVFTLVIGTLLGGRLGYFLFYQFDTVLRDPLALVRVWEGGMASHGGFIGVTVALGWFARSRRVSWLHLGDLIASAAPVGLFFGRVANFINGELWGKVATVPWAVIFPQSAKPGTPPILIEPRHPSQLYEAALEGLLLLAFAQWRLWRTDVVARAPGRLAGEFLIGYALVRVVGEAFREPDASLILGVSRGTFYSIFLIAGGVALIALSRRASKGKP
jgi:phosphatidylglycerol:prolipoprotein diacylglycerol transferase